MDVTKDSGGPRKASMALAIALSVFAVALAHGSAVRNDFVMFDDDAYVYENAHVRAGLSLESVRWAFRTSEAQTYFHPITWLSLMSDAELFGNEPSASRAVNIALHALATALLLVFLSTATGRLWPSCLAATLWAVHPLTVEAVAWAAERKAVLSTVFGLGAILAHARHGRSPSPWRLTLVLLLAVLGFLSKPALVVLPALLLLVDFWPLRRARGRIAGMVVEKLPLVAASAAVLAIVAFSARHLDMEVARPELPPRALHALAVIPKYLAATIWPSLLAVYRPFPARTALLAALFGGMLVTALSIAAIRARHATRSCWLVGPGS